jgi:hypothetical protein
MPEANVVLRGAKLGDERPGRGIGPCVELTLQQRNEVLVVLERFGFAPRGGERLYDQPMGVFAHVVERDGTLAGLQRMFGTAGGQLLFAEPTMAPRASSSNLSRSLVSHSFQLSSLTVTSSISRPR